MELPMTGDTYIDYIVRTYSGMIYRIAYQNLQIKCDAEDVVQEVLIKVLKGPAFTEERALKAWLIRVTVNHCRNVTRYYSRHRTEPLPETEAAGAPEDRRLLEELARLSADERNMIYLHYYEGYTAKEIGEMLDKKENTVSSRIRRARKKLKFMLEEGE